MEPSEKESFEEVAKYLRELKGFSSILDGVSEDFLFIDAMKEERAEVLQKLQELLDITKGFVGMSNTYAKIHSWRVCYPEKRLIVRIRGNAYSIEEANSILVDAILSHQPGHLNYFTTAEAITNFCVNTLESERRSREKAVLLKTAIDAYAPSSITYDLSKLRITLNSMPPDVAKKLTTYRRR